MNSLIALVLLSTQLAAEPVRVESLSWMAGHWSATRADGGVTEEAWLAPKGGLMLGVNRTLTAKGKVSFEFLRIEDTPDGVVYLASPSGQPATPFKLTAANSSRATFENPEHDFPKRLTYRLEDDHPIARVDGGPSAPDTAMEWRWTKQ
jgi:hypothetical protein